MSGTYDPQGKVLTNEYVREERIKDMMVIIDSKRLAFSKALSDKCDALNEIYEDLGFRADRNMYLYRIGMEVFGLSTDGISIQPMRVGVIR